MAKNNTEINGYTLTRAWFDFVLDNPDKVKSNHTALYMWLLELNNRLGWIEMFGLTTREAMDGMCCKNRNTYSDCFKDLITWGFVTVVKESKNQYQCNVIALLKNKQAQGKHVSKHEYSTTADIDTSIDTSTIASTDTIPKTNKPLNLKTFKQEEVEEYTHEKKIEIEEVIENFNPEQPIETEKEKSSAKKEKVLPGVDDVIERLTETAYWRHTLEHHKIDDAERYTLFKLFYEQKEDNYKIRLPIWKDIAEHFYYWVPLHKNKKNLQELNNHAKSKGAIHTTSRNKTAELRNGLEDLKQRSADFLRQTGG